jgi:TRAP-type C4-dicarboxylate transport system permease small subunit
MPMMKPIVAVRPLARGMHWAGGAALVGMMFVTVADVVLRSFKSPITGTYELVGFLGAVAIGFSLPQTSLDKGQVLMDFLTRRLSAVPARVLGALTRAIGAGLFALIAWNLFAMGADLRRTGDETPLLHLPHFLLAWGIATACAVECLVLAAEGLAGDGDDR